MKLITYLDPKKPSPQSSTPPTSLLQKDGRIGLRFSDSKSAEQEDNPESGLILDFQKAYEFLCQMDPNHEKLPLKEAHFTNMVSLIQDQNITLPLLKEIQNYFNEARIPANMFMPEKSLTLYSPVPEPTSVRDGYAFRQHVEAARRNRGVPMIPEFDLFPIFYFTNHLATTGPGKVFVREDHLDKLDFELEVAIVIGKQGRNIKAENADDYIFGYMIMNDWSARTLQMEEMKLNLGPAKGKDFANSFGPYLVTKDSLENKKTSTPKGAQYSLRMQAFVNNIQVSDGSVKDMSYTFAQIIERASYGVTLYPGEIIGSGTVGTGCFLELNGSKITNNQWLKVGDEVRLEIEGLGKLKNTIALEKIEK